jgi:hypothetical protein
MDEPSASVATKPLGQGEILGAPKAAAALALRLGLLAPRFGLSLQARFVCTLADRCLDQSAQKSHALSYFWGDATTKRVIIIGKTCRLCLGILHT